MWEVCKIMFTLSYGHSSAERGFTVNISLAVSIENLKEKSLIALLRVADHVSTSEETAEEVKITRDMLYYVKDVNWKYKEDLCQQQQEKENERKILKRKIGDDEIKQIKAKYCLLQREIEDLRVSADAEKLAMKAEKHKNFT